MFNRNKSFRSITFMALTAVVSLSALTFAITGVGAQKASFIDSAKEVLGISGDVAGDKTQMSFNTDTVRTPKTCATQKETNYGPIVMDMTSAPTVACATPNTVLPNNGGTSGNARAPSTRFAGSRAVYLITAAELGAAGYGVGQTVTTVGWNYQAVTAGVAGSAPLTIYMENTADATNLKSTTWATATGTMTTVHNATTTLPGVVGPFDITLTGGSPFTYTGGGIYVAFDWGPYAGTTSTVTIFCNNVLAGGLLGANSQAATVAASAFRPETRLSNDTANDIAASVLATYGEVPFGVANSNLQPIRATIKNNSNSAKTNVPVTLTITGANSFTNTQIVPSIASCGGTATVTFASFTRTALGTENVQISVPVDDIVVNNSISKTKNITSNTYSYKIPGSTASGGVGFTGAVGAFVAKFFNTSANAITDVKLEFNVASATTYKVAIYGDSGTGTPAAAPIYVDAVDRTVTVAGPVTITLPAPVALPFGIYFVGIQQTNTTNASLSFDTENPIRSGSFYLATALPFAPQAVWFDEAPGNNFKLNIGVNLQAAPTAAAASISGRVTTADGRGISNAVVSVTGGSLTSPRFVRTGSLGYFMIEDLGAGETYVVTINSKRYVFSSPSRVISLTDSISDVDFTAEAQ